MVDALVLETSVGNGVRVRLSPQPPNKASWRNGIRNRLKSDRGKPLEGSNPSGATICVCSPTAEARGLNPLK